MSQPIDPFDLMHAVRLRGVVSVEALSAMLGADTAAVTQAAEELTAQGTIFMRAGRRVSGYTLTEEGRETHAAELAARRDPEVEHQLDQVYDAFLEHNPRLKSLCARWQQVGDDAAARFQAIGELEDLHSTAELVFVHAGDIVPRFARYAPRLADAVQRVVGGEGNYFTSPLVESYHTVWFEAHEDFILALGKDRAAEGSF